MHGSTGLHVLRGLGCTRSTKPGSRSPGARTVRACGPSSPPWAAAAARRRRSRMPGGRSSRWWCWGSRGGRRWWRRSPWSPGWSSPASGTNLTSITSILFCQNRWNLDILMSMSPILWRRYIIRQFWMTLIRYFPISASWWRVILSMFSSWTVFCPLDGAIAGLEGNTDVYLLLGQVHRFH